MASRGLAVVVPPGAAFAIVAWGSSFVVTRVALQTFTPLGLVALRLLLGAALLCGIAWSRGGAARPRGRDAAVCLALAVIIAVHLSLQAVGLMYTSAINTGWIIGFMPVCIAIGAQLLGQQRLRAIGWCGVLVGTGGVFLVTLKAPPNFAEARWGDVLQIASCFSWTAYTLGAVGVIARWGALRVTAWSMAGAAALCLPAALATGITIAPPGVQAWACVLFLGFVCNGLVYYLWYRAVRNHGPTRISSLLYAEPFVTLLVALLTLGEPVTANALAGGVGVLVGVWLVAHGAQRRADNSAPAEVVDAPTTET